MKPGAAVLVVVGLVIAFPVVVVVIFSGGSSSASVLGGLGVALRAGSVPEQYAQLVTAAGGQCSAAPPSIIAAQIAQESGWNPNAVSSAGAQGIAQFMPSTWPTWSAPGQSPFDPAAAIPAMGKYDCALAAQVTGWQSQGKLPSALSVTSLTLAAYNAGANAVLAAGGIPQNGQTPNYVSTITANAAKYSAATGAPGGAFGAKVVAAAQSQIGVPYAWAGGTYTGPTLGVCSIGSAANDCHITGYDCSGLVMFALAQASGGALQVPHSADAQGKGGTRVDRSAMVPGDIISFTSPGVLVAHHVGIYIGNAQMVDAPESGALVRVDSLASSHQGETWTVARYG